MKIISASQWEPSGFEKSPEKAVKQILADVRHYGLDALEAFSKKWDGGVPQKWQISLKTAQSAWRQLPFKDCQALSTASRQLEMWSRACLPKKPKVLRRQGMTLRQQITPLESVACYVPGGKFPLVSSVLMSLIPARIAGVSRRVLLTPAKNGQVPPLILAAAHLAKATEIWPVGGAQAVAAAAYGAGFLKPVAKIVGPGNAYVTEAKRQLRDVVAIDMLAGPSELLVIVDQSTPLDWITLDLLAQAEHGLDSESLVLSRSRKVLEKLHHRLRAKALELYDLDETLQILSQVTGLQATSKKELVQTVNRIASEHLQIATSKPEDLLKQIKNFGTVFLGAQTPTALGDYVSGANHILPTSQGGRTRGGLSVEDFLVRRTIQKYLPDKSRKLYRQGAHLASLEGLKAHENSLFNRIS